MYLIEEAVDKVDPGKRRKAMPAYTEEKMHKKVKLVNWPRSIIECTRPSQLSSKNRAKILGLLRSNNENHRIRYEPTLDAPLSQQGQEQKQQKQQQEQQQQEQQQQEQQEQEQQEQEQQQQRIQQLQQQIEQQQ